MIFVKKNSPLPAAKKACSKSLESTPRIWIKMILFVSGLLNSISLEWCMFSDTYFNFNNPKMVRKKNKRSGFNSVSCRIFNDKIIEISFRHSTGDCSVRWMKYLRLHRFKYLDNVWLIPSLPECSKQMR